MAAESKDGHPTVQGTSHTHLSDSSNVPDEKFEIEFFNAYLEERPNIRKNLEQLGGNEHHNGLVFQALIELDNKFFNKVPPPRRPGSTRRAAAAAHQNTKNESSSSSDDDSSGQDVKTGRVPAAEVGQTVLGLSLIHI